VVFGEKGIGGKEKKLKIKKKKIFFTRRKANTKKLLLYFHHYLRSNRIVLKIKKNESNGFS
jgi:hypothetical protein